MDRSWSARLAKSSWNRGTCQCCLSNRIQPLVVIQLDKKILPETKKWLISKIQEAELLVHPGEDDEGDMILLSISHCTLLHSAETLGLSKIYHNGEVMPFSITDRENFSNAANDEDFVTLAEKQYIIKQRLDHLKTLEEESIPGWPMNKKILKGELIFRKLVKQGLVKKIYPLHDVVKLKAFATQWYTEISLAIPTDDIHSYFGTPIAFYFSFLVFYTWSMVPPAVMGGLLYLMPWDSLIGYITLAIFNVIWSTVVLELWKRRSAELAYNWGTLLLKSNFEEPRPSYWGPLGKNPVTRRQEPYYPSWKRKVRMWLVSGPLVCALLGLSVIGMVAFFWFERLMKYYYKQTPCFLTLPLIYLPSIVHTLYTDLMNRFYKGVAERLTEWENHRVESSFQNFYTLKIIVFTFFNSFAVLFHIAFFKQDLQLLQKRLASLLIVSQVINQCTETLIPYMKERLFPLPGKKQSKDDPDIDKIHYQGQMTTCAGLFGEYIELFLQFGYLSFFSCVYPLTGALLLLNNLTEIRTDALKFCRIFQKPFAVPAANIGIWQSAFEMLGLVSVISNCFLILMLPQMTTYCQNNEIDNKTVLFLAIVLEQALIFLKIIIAFGIPDEPEWVRIKVAQIEFQSFQALKQQKQGL
ncbi:anoctamin-10 isoform X1 [Polypterus senegalus]|uniref:anoctamin-10 isoform X1 n=1 Tax=Polypterus senegalus TaxID=55291 RepID=UPI001963FFC6|nr:anoctamin-10 isoform X1 [Polypterus senegalus]